MTTAEIESMKLLRICFVSSAIRELAKLMQLQYNATQAHHLIRIIRPHMLRIMANTFM
jgi:hypothetical protein